MNNYKVVHGTIYNRNKQVDFYPVCREFIPLQPEFISVHITNGSADEKQTSAYFQNPLVDVNAHVNIGRNGNATQTLSLSHRANYLQVNNILDESHLAGICINVCNPGKLKITPDGYTSWWGKIYDDSTIVEDGQYAWLPFSNEQVETLIGVGESISRFYHFKLSSLRKFCPTQCMNNDVWYKMGTKRIKRDHGYYEI